MFGKKKKSSLLRKLGIGSTAGALTAYIGSELNKAVKRYEIKDSKFVSDHFVLEKKKDMSKDCYTPSQRYYEFDVLNRETREVLGTAQLLMGQEEDSFYGGHIRVSGKFDKTQRRELDTTLAEIAKNHLMSHVNFVCVKGDKEKKAYYESLGAKFVKTIKVPEDSHYYIKKHHVLEQYRLDTVDEKVIQYMDLTAKRKAEKEKKAS